MDYFPIFLRLAEAPVLVVGGGQVAARKIDLLLRAGASITVVAPELCARVSQWAAVGRVQHVAQEFQPQHLDGMRLAIAATPRRAVNAWVARQADSLGIPVNVVDDPKLSRFIMPAIIDRSPVVIAVGSSGDAPVLTRRLREKLEALLPQRLGSLATLAGKLRASVRTRLGSMAQRRKFWESFFDGPLAADVLAGRSDSSSLTDEAFERHLASASRAEEAEVEDRSGEVALVGAGPGDPGLLTLHALRALQNADVVLYDRLVSREVLDLARRDAERIYVGKEGGSASTSTTQAEINALLIELARAGKRVCRLKGGDPFIFGRGGEELEALAAAGIRFQVVPGITAAQGCAAYAGIPLTHRDHAHAITFVTGHLQDTPADSSMDWSLLAHAGQTVVFYMGLNRLPAIVERLAAQGVPAGRSVAVVAHGTSSTQRVVTSTLADIVAQVERAQISSPALLMVGEVTRLHSVLQWFHQTTPHTGDWLSNDSVGISMRNAG
jgi:uroporphyrin-III C-methyltransferase/precorrin-2 dehydrogenase/sirohydrochlorin ferrochelatase